MKSSILLPIGDTHTGSTVGLHPNYIKRDGAWITVDEAGGYRYKHNENFYLNSKQKRIWRHYEDGITRMADYRQAIDADLIIAGVGDLIDGDHHNTQQLTTRNEPEQMEAFVSIMDWTLEKIGFTQPDDKLFFVEGTESHVRDNEEFIASRLPAQKFSGGFACAPFVELTVHGRLIWIFHHGVSAGYSYNQGAGLYGFLRQIYFDRLAQGKQPPDLIMTAHTHKHDYQMYSNGNRRMHGIIIPPFQEKTRFTNKLARAIVHPTRLGFAPVLISEEGIKILSPYLYEMPLGESLSW